MENVCYAFAGQIPHHNKRSPESEVWEFSFIPSASASFNGGIVIVNMISKVCFLPEVRREYFKVAHSVPSSPQWVEDDGAVR